MVLAADGMVPDSQEVAADGVALVSQEPDEGITPELLDSLPPGAFVCGRCGLVHEDRETWNRAHSRFYPCRTNAVAKMCTKLTKRNERTRAAGSEQNQNKSRIGDPAPRDQLP